MANFDYAANVPKNKGALMDFIEASTNFLNPHSSHALGKVALDEEKRIFESVLNVFPGYSCVEFISGGGTNANKRVLWDAIPFRPTGKEDTICISSIEHSSIQTTAISQLSKRGYRIIMLPVCKNGVIDMEKLEKVCREESDRIHLISIHNVNNEIGTIQPIGNIVSLVKSINPGIIIHSDISQGILIHLQDTDISRQPDIISFSSYKIGGPHIGLVVSKNYCFEDNYQGTPDVPTMVYFERALVEYVSKVDFMDQCRKIKNIIKEKVELICETLNIPIVDLSTNDMSVPYIQGYLFPKEYQGDVIVKLLSQVGVYISSGSACASYSKKGGSHVIESMGYTNTQSSIRISFSPVCIHYVDSLIQSFLQVLTKLKEVVGGKTNKAVEQVRPKVQIKEGESIEKSILRSNTPLDIPLKDIPNDYLKLIYGEIFLKGKNNRNFETALVSNIKKMLSGEKLYKDSGMSYLQTKDPEGLIEKLRFVPGIIKIMQGSTVPSDFDKINQTIASIIESTEKPIRFKVDVYLRRLKKWNGYSTTKLNCIFGQYIVDRFGDQVVVDLKNPDICIYIDIRNKTTFVSTRSIYGTQGLPIGTERKVLCVVNKDNIARSLVAVYRMLARGSVVHYMTDMDDMTLFAYINEKMGCRVSIYPTKNFDIIQDRYYGIINEYPRADNYGYRELRVTECESMQDMKTILTRFGIDIIPPQIDKPKKVLLLLSGGIDSPVAAYKLLKAGHYVEFIHFGTHISKIKNIREIISTLKSDDDIKDNIGPLTFVEFKDFQDTIIKECPESYRTLMYKVFMIKIANQIAIKNGFDMISTGNALGQVASQTPENIEICRRVSSLPIISPLIGYNKDDVVLISKKIGTFKPSTCDGTDDVCIMYLPKNPVIKGEFHIVERSLKGIPDEKLEEIPITTMVSI